MAQLQGEAKQQYVASMFARIAGRYDLMNTLITGGMHLSWKRKTARITAQGLSGRALDVASGTGDLALALARLPQIDQAVGLDLLPEMIILAKARARSPVPEATSRARPDKPWAVIRAVLRFQLWCMPPVIRVFIRS